MFLSKSKQFPTTTIFCVPADPDRIIAANFDHIYWFCFINVAFVGQLLLNRTICGSGGETWTLKEKLIAPFISLLSQTRAKVNVRNVLMKTRNIRIIVLSLLAGR